MEILVRNEDRVLVQYGEFTLEPLPEGHVIEETTDQEAAAIMEALQTAPAGVTISPDHQTITPLPPLPGMEVRPA